MNSKDGIGWGLSMPGSRRDPGLGRDGVGMERGARHCQGAGLPAQLHAVSLALCQGFQGPVQSQPGPAELSELPLGPSLPAVELSLQRGVRCGKIKERVPLLRGSPSS